MQTIIIRLRQIMIVLLMSLCMNIHLKAQTPADDPGIGGPGVGVAPAGDGSPIVPFDENMTIVLLSLGIGLGVFKGNGYELLHKN